ncbi:MAG: heparan-alpha-glucosaminide N-acetyltransferase domain-containing protein [Saprospiraceae bacterium]
MNRYLAIDFYRGVTIAFMIIVNTPGTWGYAYAPLQHADWNGCTPTDLVFPSFLFIIGVSMWFSMGKYGRQWSPALGWKILRRTALLFLVGLLLNKFPIYWGDWDHWRIFGVPQRLALGYGLASVLVLTLPRRVLIWVSAGILVVYWGILHRFGAPGFDPYGLEGNVVLRVDRWLMGNNHLWHGERIAFDPEGLLSTLPAVVTVILGWLSGELMAYRSKQKDLLIRDLLVFGLLCGFIGLAWDLFFPINKKLWTSSFVLYAGGISMVLLAASIWLIEVRGWRNGTGFFLAFGANSLFAYVFSEVLILIFQNIRWGEDMNAQKWIYATVFEPIEGAEFSSFLFSLSYLLVCWLVCRWLYVRQIFIKL